MRKSGCAPCKFCQNSACVCPAELNKMRVEFEKTEEQIRALLSIFKQRKPWEKLPQNRFCRFVYLSVGGRKRLVPALIISITVTQALFHYFPLRLIALIPYLLINPDIKETISSCFTLSRLEIALNILVLGSILFIEFKEKLDERAVIKNQYQLLLECREKRTHEIEDFKNKSPDSFDQLVATRLLEHLRDELCFTYEIVENPDLSNPPEGQQPRHEISTESKMPTIDSVFAYIKKSEPNLDNKITQVAVAFWKIPTLVKHQEFKALAQRSACAIL